MKIKVGIAAIIYITMFLFSPILVSGQNYVSHWTWSENLREGDYFKWEVTMTWDGTPITELDDNNDGPPFVDGSIIEVWINQGPFDLYFEENTTEAQLSPYFGYNLDGDKTVNPELLPAFVFPNTYIMDDGSTWNAFDYLISNNTDLPFFDDGMTVNQEIVNGQFHATATKVYLDEGRTVNQFFNYNVDLGLLHYISMSETYTNGSEMLATINLTQSHTSGENDLPEGSSFSDLLDTGDNFTWTIDQLVEQGVPVTTGEPNKPIEGSIIEIIVLDEPENIDLTDPDLNPDLYFAMTIDGTSVLITEVFEGPASFSQFIYPLIIDHGNGTIYNFFEFVVDNIGDGKIFGEQVTSATASIVNNIFSLDIVESKDDGQRTVVQELEFNADNGVMRYLHRTETWTNGSIEFELEITLSDEFYVGETSTGIDTSTAIDTSGAGFPVPAPGFIWLLPALIVVPIIRRKK